jgi:hypothetical protein
VPWLDGRWPKGIASLVCEGLKRKKRTVNKAFHGDFWISQINTRNGLSLDHIVQFANLWEVLQVIHLNPNLTDSILRKLAFDGWYSSKSAYAMQYLRQTNSCISSIVWKPCPPPSPKSKSFAYKIEFGRLIRSKREGGQIVEDVIFVTKFKNQPPTFFSRVASLFVFG